MFHVRNPPAGNYRRDTSDMELVIGKPLMILYKEGIFEGLKKNSAQKKCNFVFLVTLQHHSWASYVGFVALFQLQDAC